MIYILGGTIEGRNVLFVGKDGAFHGGKKIAHAKNGLPDFNGYHKAGYTWSMSAAIWWMNYQPKVIEFTGLDEVETALLDKKILQFRNNAGGIVATYLKDDYKIRVVDKCALIDEKFETAKPFYEHQ